MKIVKEFILRNIAGETVLVPTGATSQEFNGLITMTDTAKFIWEHLEKAESFKELVGMMVEEYEVEEPIAKADAHQFISELLKHGFVECSKEDKSW